MSCALTGRSPVRGRPRRPRRPPRWLAAFSSVLAVAVLAGCGVGQGSARTIGPDDTIKVGVIPVSDFAPVYVAKDEGYFAREGLDVQIQVMQNAAAIAPSVINGQLQFGTAAVPPFLAAVGKGLPLKAVANGCSITPQADEDPSALVAAPGAGIRRPADLEGKTVAVNALSSIVHVVAAAAVKADGGDPAKVTFVAMPFPDMIPALTRGAIDAASLVEPFYTKALGAGAGLVTNTYSATLSPGTFTVIFTAGPFIDRNPQVVEKFRRAVDRASRAAAEHPEKVAAVLEKYGKLPSEVSRKIRLPHYTDDLDITAMADTADLMRRLGFLSGPVDTEGAIWK